MIRRNIYNNTQSTSQISNTNNNKFFKFIIKGNTNNNIRLLNLKFDKTTTINVYPLLSNINLSLGDILTYNKFDQVIIDTT